MLARNLLKSIHWIELIMTKGTPQEIANGLLEKNKIQTNVFIKLQKLVMQGFDCETINIK